jgi:hypothetical protein
MAGSPAPKRPEKPSVLCSPSKPSLVLPSPRTMLAVLVLDEHVRAADGPGLVVVLLAVKRELRAFVLGDDQLLGFGEHAASAAGGIVGGAVDAGFVDVLLASVDEVRHQANDLAGREVIAGLLVSLFVEAHHQMLEQVAPLQVVDPAGVQIDLGHLLRFQCLPPLQNGILGRLSDAVEPPQNDHWKHDQAILRGPVRPLSRFAISQMLAFSSSCA